MLRLLPAGAALAALALLAPARAAAQSCLAFPSFDAGPSNVSAVTDFADAANALGVAYHSSRGRGFWGVQGLYRDYQDLEESSFAVGGLVGWQRTGGRTQQVAWCPVLTGDYEFGPSGDGFDGSSLGFSGGVAAGIPIRADGGITLVPAGSFRLAWRQTRVEFTDLPGVDESDTYGILGLALSFFVGEQVAITPHASFPVGLQGGQSSFGVTFSVPLGGR
jgi:hypothetical protein